MNKKTLRTAGVVALTVGAAAAVIAFSPLGRFLQSSLIQAGYNEIDPGLYIGQERMEGTVRNLRAQQGISLRAEPVKEGNDTFVNVYVTANVDTSQFRADAFKAVMEYDKSRLSLTGVDNAFAPVSFSGTVDTDFTQIVKDASGNETGTLYIGLNKSSEFTKPSESLLRIKFKVQPGTSYTDIAVRTMRLYKREDLLDATKPTLYLNRDDSANTTAQKLTVTFDGTTITATDATSADGSKTRTETYKKADGTVVKTVVTTTNSQGKIVKVVTTLSTGEVETREYSYGSDGSYTVVITNKPVSGTTLVTTEQYDSVGLLKSRTTGTGTTLATNANTNATNTNTNSSSSNSNGNGNTNGVTSAVSTTNTNSVTVNTGTATTSATCNPSPSERFTDTAGHWSADIVEQARLKCIISGKSIGIFAPDAPVTRAELTKIAVEAFKVSQNQGGDAGFSDVASGEWYAAYIRAAKLADIVSGYSDGSFKPNSSVNRAEALKIILEAGVKSGTSRPVGNLDMAFSTWLSQNPTFSYVRFPDVKVADWFGKYVLTGFQQGIVSGYSDRGVDVFRPAQPVTRAEAVKMIMSIVQ